MIVVKKASPGLDPTGGFGRHLGPGFVIEEYDGSRPLAEQVAEAQVLLIRSVPVPRKVIDAAPLLKLIQRPGAHVEGVDLEYAAARGIPVCNMPPTELGASPAVAEHAMALMVAVAKAYREGRRLAAAGQTGGPPTLQLGGKTLGLVGIGSTGESLIPMARGLGMRVIAVRRSVEPGMADRLGLGWLGTMERLEELLAESDVVSIHLPLTAATHGLFGREQFARMKPGAILINIARGAIVDEAALIEALAAGRLGGAGLDVFAAEPLDPSSPLLQLPNVVTTPHIAGVTIESHDLMGRLVAENIRRVLAGETPRNLLNRTGGKIQ